MTVIDEKPLPAKVVDDEYDNEAAIDASIAAITESIGMGVLESSQDDNTQNTKNKSDWSVDRKTSIRIIMKKKKEEERFDLDEDVYALITVCPVLSAPFFLALLVIAIKLTCYIILLFDIPFSKRILTDRVPTTFVRFFLIPVSVAMQEDLMNAYFFFANGIYCPSMLEVSNAATKRKLYLSYSIRTIDGILSLLVNFTVMLTTTNTLGVFLNFAALQFLQSIDDVFYELIEKGFVGDTMEHWCYLCSQVTIARRHEESNKRFLCFRISHLDTILAGITFVFCLLFWIVLTTAEYNDAAGDRLYGALDKFIDILNGTGVNATDVNATDVNAIDIDVRY